MAQHNRVWQNGLEFVVLDDGRLFPVLKGGDGPEVPAADPNLVRKQNMLLDLQTQNANRSKKLEPILLERAGLRYNPDTKTYEDVDPSLTQMKRDIERMQLERSQKALKGELPVSKTLQREFQLGQQRLDEELYRKGGPGHKHSTAGTLKQEAFDRNRIALQEAEQRDMLTTAEALALNRQNSRSVEASQIENPFAAQARMLIPAQQSLSSARDQDNYTRGMQYQSNVAAGQDRAGYISAGLGLAGMAGMAFLSDPDAKTDIEPVSDAELLAALRRMPVKKWKYKHDGTKHIGAMADKMPRTVSNGKAVDLVSYLGLLTGSIRELDRLVKGRDVDADYWVLDEEPLTPAMALAL